MHHIAIWYPTDVPDYPDYRILGIYMCSTDPQIKQIIVNYFTKQNNPRVLIASEAFTTGISMHTLHWNNFRYNRIRKGSRIMLK